MNAPLRPRRALITDINMVPFTDVVLVLLVIFMVTTPFLFQGAFTVNLPRVSAPNPNLPEAITLDVGQGGRLALNGREVKFEELSGALTSLLKEKPGSTLVVQADDGVSYGTVAGVLGQAYQAGAVKMGLAVQQDRGAPPAEVPAPSAPTTAIKP